MFRPSPYSSFLRASGLVAFGGAINSIAIPLIAVNFLGVSGFELGVIVSVEQVAWLVIGLPAGVFIDRWMRTRVLFAALLGRAFFIGLVPLALWLDLLTPRVLIGLGLIVGVFEVFFGVVQSAMLPALAPATGLAQASARVNAFRTASGLSGGAAVGPIVAVVGAPAALLVDATCCLAASAIVSRIDGAGGHSAPRSPFCRELAEGVRLVFGNPLLRTLTLGTMSFNFFMGAEYVLSFLFLRSLDVPASLYGVLFGFSGIGALAGSFAMPRVLRHWSDARLWRFFLVLGPSTGLMIPLAQRRFGLVAFALGSFALAFSVAISSTIGYAARQSVCPPELLGRTGSVVSVLTWGIIPVGALLGGWLGDFLGARGAIAAVAVGFFVEPLFIRFTSVWGRDQFVAPDLVRARR